MIPSRVLRAHCALVTFAVLLAVMSACGGDPNAPSDDVASGDVAPTDAADVGMQDDSGDPRDVGDDAVPDAGEDVGDEPDATDADVDDAAPDVGDAGDDSGDATPDVIDADVMDADATDTSDASDASDARDATDSGDADADATDADAGDVGDSDASDVGDADASDADPCDENPCGGCEPLRFDDAAAAPGDACAGPCDDGVLICAGTDALRCEAPPRNGCGGCDPLDGVPETSCGDERIDGSGRWRCIGADDVACVGASTNACGGSAPLDPPFGAPCGDAGLGAYVCDGTDDVTCDDRPTNACGGTTRLGASPGTSCGPCGAVWTCDGTDDLTCPAPANLCGGCEPLRGEPGASCAEAATFACDGPDAVECIRGAVGACAADIADDVAIGTPCGPCGDGRIGCEDGAEACIGASERNECGGCGPLPGSSTERCADDATLRCDDAGGLVCDGPLGEIGDPCLDDASCASSLCTPLATHSDLRVCAEYCDPDADDLCAADEACFVLTLEDPTAALEARAACEAECSGPDVFVCRAACAEAHPIPAHYRCLPTDRCFDGDGDGYGVAGSCRFDCDDREPLRNRDALEVCDGLDNDCDGRVDETADAELGCSLPDVCAAGVCATPEVCGVDGDEDGDGLSDCDDPDCAAHFDCVEGGACLNAFDIEAVFAGARGDILTACYAACIEDIDFGGCMTTCLAEGEYVSADCAPCIGEWVRCQAVDCGEACADGGDDCIACGATCREARNACGGLEGFEPCETHGQPCSSVDQSTPNYVCNVARGVCLQGCAVDIGTSCPDGAACVDSDRIDEGDRVPRGVCLPGDCAMTYGDTACVDDATCVLSSDRAASFCEAAGDVPAGGRCEVGDEPGASADDRCAPGLLCLSNRCTDVCDARIAAADTGCDDDLGCVPVFASSARNAPGVCAVACDAWSTGACPLGEACVPNRGEPGAREAFYCAPVDTPGADGTPCTLGDHCDEGLVCTDRVDGVPTCRPICDVVDPDAGTLASCPDETLCLSAEVGRLGMCHDACVPFSDTDTCADGGVCQPQRDAFRYAPGVGACVPAREGPGVGEACTVGDRLSCGGAALCMDDPEGFGATCHATCDPFADTCGPGETCAFVPGLVEFGATLGVCTSVTDPATPLMPCTAPSGAACGDGGGCIDLGEETFCLLPCRSGDDCPGGTSCDTWIDWDTRPIDIGVCR